MISFCARTAFGEPAFNAGLPLGEIAQRLLRGEIPYGGFGADAFDLDLEPVDGVHDQEGSGEDGPDDAADRADGSPIPPPSAAVSRALIVGGRGGLEVRGAGQW